MTSRDESTIEHADYARAMLNILEDFAEEKARLELAQRAMMNLLDDFDAERIKVAETAAMLARSNADLEQFAHVTSHDLQEPLRMISSYVQLLAKRYEGHIDAQADKYIRYAVEGVRRMEALIEAVLEYSRVSRGELRRDTMNTEVALERALSNLQRSIQEAGATVTHGPLPTVNADFAQLSRVFQNLVANAIKFHHPDHRPVVHISGERRDDGCEFVVTDNGIGIDPADFDRVFVMFERVGEGRRHAGVGLGLPICKNVIERHGGRIWIESTSGHGTSFHFTIPAPRK